MLSVVHESSIRQPRFGRLYQREALSLIEVTAIVSSPGTCAGDVLVVVMVMGFWCLRGVS